MKLILPIVLALSVASCALPESTARTGSPRPTLFIKGAPEGTILFVDGLSVGAANEFNGSPKVLIVEEGTHTVELRRAGAVLHSEKVFISNGETRGVSVNAGAK